MAYFLPLLPVLIISKHETQYIYASSIAISVALALVWAPRLVYAVPTIALVVILALHGLRIQRYMYITGACQTRVLLTTAAVLPFVKASSSSDRLWRCQYACGGSSRAYRPHFLRR